MLVVEGLLPFLSPAAWRRVFQRAHADERRADPLPRLASMLAGLVLLVFFAS